MNVNEINLINELSKNGYVVLLVNETDARLLNMELEEILKFELVESDLYLGLKEQIDIQIEVNKESKVKKSFEREIHKIEQIIKDRDIFGGEVDRYPDMSCAV